MPVSPGRPRGGPGIGRRRKPINPTQVWKGTGTARNNTMTTFGAGRMTTNIGGARMIDSMGYPYNDAATSYHRRNHHALSKAAADISRFGVVNHGIYAGCKLRSVGFIESDGAAGQTRHLARDLEGNGPYDGNPYSHAASVPSHSTCSWTPDHGYMLCEYLRDRGDPKQLIAADHLSIFTYDDNAKSYKHLGVSKDYKTLEEMASIDGNVWHYRYQLPVGSGKVLDLRDTYVFVNANKRITRIEVSSDAGRHWVLMSESFDTRIP